MTSPASPSIALITSRELPTGGPDAAGIIAALTRAGANAQVVAWDCSAVEWSDFTLLVLTWPWDYSERLPEFLSWLDRLPEQQRLLNQEQVQWNLDKSYLLGLERHGLPVLPTLVMRSGAPAENPLSVILGSGRTVTKPSVGAGGRGVLLYAQVADALASVPSSGGLVTTSTLIQSFDPRIMHGEYSLVYLGGRLSHAVKKTPAAGEFRVQPHWGGRTSRVDPPRDVISLGDAVSAALEHPAAYARVDIIAGGERPPTLMEVELIEPDLFLRYAPESFDRYAEVLCAAARTDPPPSSCLWRSRDALFATRLHPPRAGRKGARACASVRASSRGSSPGDV